MSNINRLMKIERWETQSQHQQSSMSFGGETMGFGGELSLTSTTYYYYTEEGNVYYVLTQNEDDTSQTTRLGYANNGRAVTFVMGETTSPGYLLNYLREFRYDGARQRYLDINYDPEAFQTNQPPDNFVPLQGGTTWTDYDDDEPYGDFSVTSGNPTIVTNLRSFELGIGRNEWSNGTTSAANTAYYHGDQIGTTRFLTNPTGGKIDADVYTAFGERVAGVVSGPRDRYGYAGAWGYQAEPDSVGFPFLHVGARYYDPSTGRFLQRDPIGISGGRNVYAYGVNDPLGYVDPDGLQVAIPIAGAGAVTGGVISGPVGVAVVGGGFVIGLGIGIVVEMSHQSKIKELMERGDLVGEWVRNQQIRKRTETDPKVEDVPLIVEGPWRLESG